MKPMLAAAAKPEKLKFPLYVQAKLDGIRCVIVDGVALSRTLKPIPNKEIQAALGKDVYNGLDGELLVGDPTADSAYRDTTSFVMAPNKTGAPWCFHVFDNWARPGQYDVRYSFSKWNIDTSGLWASGKAQMVPWRMAYDADYLEHFEQQMIDKGYEGVILRSVSAPYKFGRGSVTAGDLLKLKRYEDWEAEVIGVEEEMHNGNEAVTNALGRTERSTVKANKTGKGTLGALVVRGINGPAEGVEFKVGTGFDAATRAQLWRTYQEHKLKGKVIKYKSFPVGVKDKPRHPVFLGFRDMELDG